jgi:hypothetical protein
VDSSAAHGALEILSYFHAIFPSPLLALPTLDCRPATALTWSTTLPLVATSTLSYEVTIREAVGRVLPVGANGEDVVRRLGDVGGCSCGVHWV